MFDYVIAGGGTAGCVLAHRLSKNPKLRVCLIEAGPPDGHPMINMPIGILWMMRSRVLNWNFQTTAEGGLGGRSMFWPRGRTLGGSSSSNAMCYIRGHARDYDEWAQLGNKGWAYDDVLPYFRKSENQCRGESDYHGIDGPLHVSDPVSPSRLSEVFLEACAQVGYKANSDFNGPDQEGVGLYQVMQRKGRRCSAARAFLDTARARDNLTIITDAHVTKVSISGRRAVGVEYVFQGRKLLVSAKKEVILSSGVIQSPQVLMHSGVGPRDILKNFGIPVITDLPGVGQNLQDHLDVTVVHASKKAHSIGITAKNVLLGPLNALRYGLLGTGMLTTNGAEATGFIKSRPDIAVPDLQLQFVPARMRDHGRDLRFLCGDGYSLHVCQLRPKSRGHVTLAGSDPMAPPAISPNFLSHPDDVQTMVAGVKIVKQILDAPAFSPYRGEALVPCGLIQSDREIERFIRDHAESIYHPVGTCKMGSDDMAVVDDQLRVHGLQGLRVVDASVMPLLVGGNTTAPTIMIAEKASDMILSA